VNDNPTDAFPFSIQRMEENDLPAVMHIEQASFALPWPLKTYLYEITHDNLAYYYVLKPLPPLVSLLPAILAYVGFWLLYDEAHIGTIASHPKLRHHGFGELILLHAIEEGKTLGARVITLEVRETNYAAQALYKKYQFTEMGRRPRYYQDNDEDALIMTTPDLKYPAYSSFLLEQRNALYQKLLDLKGGLLSSKSGAEE
jgi:[ribosomal protein S18]-alanine N-acetyltransferase